MACLAKGIPIFGGFKFPFSMKKDGPRSVFLSSGASFHLPRLPLLKLEKNGKRGSAVCLVAMEGWKPTIIANAEGQLTTPSVVAYTKSGDRLVGQIAKRQSVVIPENTFYSVKRFIEKKIHEVNEESKQVSYHILSNDNGNVKLDCPAIGKQLAVVEITAQSLKLVMEYFRCCLYLGIHIWVVMTLTRIVDWLALNFKRDEGIDLLKDKQALQRLTETAEIAKIELSSLTQTDTSLPFITTSADGPKHTKTTLTRAKFEELCSDLLDRLIKPVENSLRDAEVSFKDLAEVILVGGSTHIPSFQELVKELTGK